MMLWRILLATAFIAAVSPPTPIFNFVTKREREKKREVPRRLFFPGYGTCIWGEG